MSTQAAKETRRGGQGRGRSASWGADGAGAGAVAVGRRSWSRQLCAAAKPPACRDQQGKNPESCTGRAPPCHRAPVLDQILHGTIVGGGVEQGLGVPRVTFVSPRQKLQSDSTYSSELGLDAEQNVDSHTNTISRGN